ncbi:hypothetical protein CROQUDRAFT_655468 [Cronartium quercuum f. sp. fusiforme G11]|uniref:sterol esterase n=1 Tax=Cronartium quercuum f. sp. fusiforme G11 TaxID=708437 RepID=A0A9P6TDL7_9BASI|nr:hypothetical protein CROQUDRAFT_655468 [Cronartium quercuum f. sp. fusiforme G11]
MSSPSSSTSLLHRRSRLTSPNPDSNNHNHNNHENSESPTKTNIPNINTNNSIQTLHYLSGPSPFDGLITPIKSTCSNLQTQSIHSEQLVHPKSSSERFGHDPLGLDKSHLNNLLPSHFGSQDGVSFPSTSRGGPLPETTLKRKFRLFCLQFISALLSNLFLLLIVSYGLCYRGIVNLFKKITFRNSIKNQFRDWDNYNKWKDEKITKDPNYYAESAGYRIIEQVVETLDGYYLKVWKVIVPTKLEQSNGNGKGGYPVLIQHGLFQSAGSFITSEERSLAFWLAEHGGYQVYLGNNRGVFDMGHRKYKRSDPRFWDYNIKELALYDLPALVDHVLNETGHKKLAFIGHSQGNATMFCSLAQGMVPSLSSKLSCFIALAPAVYAGPLTNGFPFVLLKSMRWRTWRRFFGVLDFMPIMRLSADYLPGKLFGFFGYQMFAFLFSWTDQNWLMRRKTKMFRFVPTPVSSAGIFWWTGYQGFSTRGCVLDPQVERWFDERFPPLAIYHGGKDFLVLAEPLLERLRTHENYVKLIRNFKLEDGEHCDHFWHADAVELCFHHILEDIESTKLVGEEGRNSIEQDPIQAILVEPSAHLNEADLIDLGTNERDEVDEERDSKQAPMMDLPKDV